METELQGVNEQVFAAPAAGQPENAEKSAPDRPLQPPEENERYAAARRRAEEEFHKKEQLRNGRYAEMFGHLKNPRTGVPVQTEADFFDLVEEAGAFESAPPAYEAKEDAEPTRAQLETFIKEELSALKNEYGLEEIGLEELAKQPSGERVLSLWAGGVPLADAFAAVNHKALMNRQRQAAKQEALNALHGKEHLLPTSLGEGDGGAEVPGEIKAQYRSFFPGWSESQIRKDYQKHK